MIHFFDDYLSPNGSHRAKLSVHAISHAIISSFVPDQAVDQQFLGRLIEDISTFKNNSSLFALPKSMTLQPPLMML
jgi:hypothetical protein